MNKETSLRLVLVIFLIQAGIVFGETAKIPLPQILGTYDFDGTISRTASFNFDTPYIEIQAVSIELAGTAQLGHAHDYFNPEERHDIAGSLESKISPPGTSYWTTRIYSFTTPFDIVQPFTWVWYPNYCEPSWNYLVNGNVTVDFQLIITGNTIMDTYPSYNITQAYLVITYMPVGATYYSGGDGSQNNPWQIANKADLIDLASNTNHYGDYFVMTNDIDLTGNNFTEALIAIDKSSLTGFQGVAFSGVFDGKGFSIKHLAVNGGSYAGLFGYLNGGRIKNLGVEVGSVSGGLYVGGLLGYNYNGIITNCYYKGIAGMDGGLSHALGGLVGYNDGGSISSCYSDCSINNNFTTGGLVGINYRGSISNCHSSGNVTGSGVLQPPFLGGIVGENLNGTISNCYSTCSISSGNNSGGLVGLNSSNISNCFWDITVQSHDTKNIGLDHAGTATNVSGLTTSQMKQKATYITSPANWDFINTWAIGENQTYPYLRQTPASDITQDKKVDYFDLAALAENWLTGVE